jgi:hypothetical protein
MYHYVSAGPHNLDLYEAGTYPTIKLSPFGHPARLYAI